MSAARQSMASKTRSVASTRPAVRPASCQLPACNQACASISSVGNAGLLRQDAPANSNRAPHLQEIAERRLPAAVACVMRQLHREGVGLHHMLYSRGPRCHRLQAAQHARETARWGGAALKGGQSGGAKRDSTGSPSPSCAGGRTVSWTPAAACPPSIR